MTPKALSPNVSVSPQIGADDAAAAAAQGFRSIICNRPDGEQDGQTAFAEIESAARAAGLETAFIPISGGQFPQDKVTAFATAAETMPKPILAYCRTGTRSAIIWALSNNGNLTAEERIRTGIRAGYDFEPFRARMLDSQ